MALGFVTGATGFLGRNLVHQLSRSGWDVIALVRDPSAEAAKDIAKLKNVKLAKGDIRIAHTLLKALPRGLDVVFHCAADTSTWSGHRVQQSEVNIEGTKNVIYATYEAQAQVMVHVSTASVYGDQKAMPYDESAIKRGRSSVSNYVRSKLEAERAIMRAVERGLEAVIVNPGHMMGRFDKNNWATLIQMTDQEALPGIPAGSGCFAHVQSVAEAIIRAAEVGKSGENYLLGGPHASFEDVITLIAEELGKEPPSRIVPGWLLDKLGRWNGFKSKFTRKPPQGMTREAAWFVSHDDHFTSEKSAKQLGYGMPDLKTVVRDAVSWQAQVGSVSLGGQQPIALTTAPDGSQVKPREDEDDGMTLIEKSQARTAAAPKGQKKRQFSS